MTNHSPQAALKLVIVGSLCMLSTLSFAQIFSDDFDDFGAMSRFSIPFQSTELDPPVFDGFVNYSFDYASLPGIAGVQVPPAPHSTGETTIGIAISLNITDDPVDEGEAIGVSPIIASLPTDYTISVDAYIYYESGGGASEHAVLGINADQTAVPFTFKPEGAGQFYHVPHDSGFNVATFPDDYYLAADGALFELYDGDGPDDATDSIPDAETLGIFPAGSSPVFADEVGFPGNQWMELTLTKGGSELNFYINGVLINTYDASGGASSGSIVLGGADIFNSANPTNLILFDNLLVVEGVVPPIQPEGDNADFNGDGLVDGADFLDWQRGFGTPDAQRINGDADGDMDVDADDLDIWKAQYGTMPEAALAAVPEPSSLILLVLSTIGVLRRCRTSR